MVFTNGARQKIDTLRVAQKQKAAAEQQTPLLEQLLLCMELS